MRFGNGFIPIVKPTANPQNWWMIQLVDGSTTSVNGSATTVEPTTNLRDWWIVQQRQLNQPSIYDIGK